MFFKNDSVFANNYLNVNKKRHKSLFLWHFSRKTELLEMLNES